MLPALLALATAVTLAPSDTTTYLVLNHGRPAGDMRVVRSGDSVTVRYLFVDRNRGTRLEQRYRVRADGSLVAAESRPVDANGVSGDPTDRFEVVADSIRRSARGNTTAQRLEPGTYYGLGGTPYDQALLARWLLTQPNHSAKLPNGTPLRLEIGRDTVVRTRAGRERVRMMLVHAGKSPTPSLVWLDARGALLASAAGWFITVRPGAESALPTLRALEIAYRRAKADSLGAMLARPTTGVLAIRNGDVFDAETATMRPRTTVLVRGDRIIGVGPADSLAIPSGATIIDATGKTVMPGMWEMHGHLQTTSETSAAPIQLSLGLTTVRDLAADIDVATSARERASAGRLLSPRYVLAGFIEGPGRWAGPSDVIVRTEDEARASVARYDSLGYKQIKVYNLVHPDLIPTIAAEAHRRGMRLSGHIPRGLSVPAATALGFDEVNHAAFLFSTFYPDSLYLPTMRAYSAVAAAVAPNVDVEGAPMTALIETLKARGTVIDGTFAIWLTSGAGASVGAPPSAGNSGARADANYVRLIKRLYDAGVTLVPGTDQGASATYNSELELYERAGIPAPQVLRIATLGSARVMKDDRDYGSIVAGKIADIVIIDGKPAEHVSDLRKITQVIRAGRAYTPTELRAAAGLVAR